MLKKIDNVWESRVPEGIEQTLERAGSLEGNRTRIHLKDGCRIQISCEKLNRFVLKAGSKDRNLIHRMKYRVAPFLFLHVMIDTKLPRPVLLGIGPNPIGVAQFKLRCTSSI
jgi:hypothetical protein